MSAAVSPKASTASTTGFASGEQPLGGVDTSADMLAATATRPQRPKTLLRHKVHCIFCKFNGGRRCSRCAIPQENGGLARLQIEDSAKPLLRGLATATWITDDMLAMSRPSSRSISQYQLIDQFVNLGITTIFNLEEPGEHPYCGGEPLTTEGDYTYMPSTFEIAGITVITGGWIDLGTPKLEAHAQLVRKACEVLDRGQKIAVHCHAGFGRTGVLIACIMVYREKRDPVEVITAIRARRSKCIQNPRQASFVKKFGKHCASLLDGDNGDHSAGPPQLPNSPDQKSVHPVLGGAVKQTDDGA